MICSFCITPGVSNNHLLFLNAPCLSLNHFSYGGASVNGISLSVFDSGNNSYDNPVSQTQKKNEEQKKIRKICPLFFSFFLSYPYDPLEFFPDFVPFSLDSHAIAQVQFS